MSFSDRVFKFCKKIPKGKVTTYSKLGCACGSKKAARAVGNILNKNRDFEKIPCHRVVRENGCVGGYVFGSKKKKELLKKEGIIFMKNEKIDLEKCLFKF